MFKRCLLVITLLLALQMLLLAAGDSKAVDREMNGLIEQLGSLRGSEREKAARALKGHGLKAFAPLLRALDHDNPEIRGRARELFSAFKFIADMRAPWPKCYHGSERALAVAADCAETDPEIAVRLYEAAVETYPYFLNSHDVRAAFKHALKNAPQQTRETFYRSGPGLYLASKHKEYVAQHPNGFYAPYAQYCAIAGYDTYFIDWQKHNSRGKLVIRDPDVEIKAWSEYLETYSGFKGCDDANYRLGRALEKKQMLVRACLQFRMKHPDGDMKRMSIERMQFIMETRMDARTIMTVAAMAQREKADTSAVLLDDSELRALCSYLCAMKFYYARNFHEAARAFKAVAELPIGTSDFSRNVRQQALERAAFSVEAADIARIETADGLYAYAFHIYKKAGRTFMADVVSSPGGRSSYDAAEPKEFFPRRTRFWQSAQVYQQVLEKYPWADVTPKALFMLGNCYCRLGEKANAFWRPQMKENIKKSIFYFERVVQEHRDHKLAPAARKAATMLRKKWDVE
jgi:tetratricopeptide (TPR) repeat protein